MCHGRPPDAFRQAPSDERLKGLCVEAGPAGGQRGGCVRPGPREGWAQGPPPLFLPSHDCSYAPLHMGPSGQIWVAELKPIIRFTPASSQPVLSGELFRLLPSFSCRLRFVADEQGVFLKAAGCPGRPPFTWVALLPGLAQGFPWLNIFFFIKTGGKMYLGPLVCPDSCWEQRRCYESQGSMKSSPVFRPSPGMRLGWPLPLQG